MFFTILIKLRFLSKFLSKVTCNLNIKKTESRKEKTYKKKIQFHCPTSINTNLVLKSFAMVMRTRIFAVKFIDSGRCRTSKISKTELLVTIIKVLKLHFRLHRRPR